jgi:hypothetical protein
VISALGMSPGGLESRTALEEDGVPAPRQPTPGPCGFVSETARMHGTPRWILLPGSLATSWAWHPNATEAHEP